MSGIAVVLCAILALGADDPPSGTVPQKESSAAPVMSAREYCQFFYDRREQRIQAVMVEMKMEQDKWDWDKTSSAKKVQINAPFQLRLKRLIANRNLEFDTLSDSMGFEGVKMGAVFRPPPLIKKPSKGIQTKFPLKCVRHLTNRSLLANGSHVMPIDNGVKVTWFNVVISQTPVGPHPEGSEITLTGIWHRVADTEIKHEPVRTFAPWPHEDEAKKMWPTFLAEQEEKAGKERKAETFPGPTDKGK